jgi:hypothetical protein
MVDNVADYYAIVGIGDTLEYKQKPQQQQHQYTNTSTSSSSPFQQSQEDKQQQQQQSPLLFNNNDTGTTTVEEQERFLREIIHLQWKVLMIDDDDNNNSNMNQTYNDYMEKDLDNNKHDNNNNSINHHGNHDVHNDDDIENCWSTLYQTRPMRCNNHNNKNNSIIMDDANFDWYTGLMFHNNSQLNVSSVQQQQQQSQMKLTKKVPITNTTLPTYDNRNYRNLNPNIRMKLYLSYQQRRHIHNHDTTTTINNNYHNHNTDHTISNFHKIMIPAIADIQLLYIQLHRNIIVIHDRNNNMNNANTSNIPTIQQQQNTPSSSTSTTLPFGQFRVGASATDPNKKNITTILPDLWKRCTTTTATTTHLDTTAMQAQIHRYTNNNNESYDRNDIVTLESLLRLPENFTEWCIPSIYQYIYNPKNFSNISINQNNNPKILHTENDWKTALVMNHNNNDDIDVYCYIPVIAIRRQRVTNEQRYNEDAAISDIMIQRSIIPTTNSTNCSSSNNNNNHRHHRTDSNDGIDQEYDHHQYCNNGNNNNHIDDIDDVDSDDEMSSADNILGQTSWIKIINPYNAISTQILSNIPTIVVRKNHPYGLCDIPYTTRVIGRFPFKNYSNVPLPIEEIPMFCYPKMGNKLYRTQYSSIPIPQYYGFVVKNERGDNIYISCVSFMEPLTSNKVHQLEQLSYQLRYISIPNYKYFMDRQQKFQKSIQNGGTNDDEYDEYHYTESKTTSTPTIAATQNNCLVTAFSDMTTFENKTICVVSRYPYWTAFRKFLSHLHIVTTSSVPSDIPIERYISHLLLSVKLPKPGGPSMIVPLPTLNTPMILTLPHEKDLPLLDLPYHRLFSCLNNKTIITIVLGLLALERKVIIMSKRPSLVLDIAELLRSLLFPFELCAPYVPRLTEPFKSSLDFPGAIFVGIHDDGDPSGLAATVKATYPEESTVIDLETGEMDCDGNRYEILTSLWNIIPHTPRKALLSELDALCRDANLVDGQEPIESLTDSAFFVDLSDAVDGNDVNAATKQCLDDRGIRDAFLRFFCAILGGYERFLVVPDANFLISGDEWFDAPAFLASVPSGNASYLTSLVSTQLFQSFIQRRTEASDVHCMLFDECLTEFYSSTVPYGRLGGDVEVIQSDDASHPQILYSLLVDQFATLANSVCDPPAILMNRSMDASEADSSFTRAVGSIADSSAIHSESIVTQSGDLISVPSTYDLSPGKKYIYCVDGNPFFPHLLNPNLFLPREPTSWTITLTKSPDPLLARSERELEEANRRRRMAVPQVGVTQRRCFWQLPKLMASHFLGSWLLCVPALVSQAHLTNEQQSRYILRALGALRLLRSRQRIVPDEAAYRALMVACGRAQSDRRIELVKLFGLLRSDGIFPSAVTLGQYTKALAEGYSKRLTENYQGKDLDHGIEVTSLKGRDDVVTTQQNYLDLQLEISLNKLDTSLYALEYHGRRWRQRSAFAERGMSTDNGDDAGIEAKMKRIDSRVWQPAVYSTSFIPYSLERSSQHQGVRLIAIWSRTQCCTNCSYVPLEEEVQAGWDSLNGKNDVPGAIACPRCDAPLIPRLGFREMAIDDALNIDPKSTQSNLFSEPGADFQELPPQIGSIIETPVAEDGVCYVTYISPAILREALEHYVEDYGDGIFDRDQLKELDPEIFINFWWYCTRFALPLPLPTSLDSIHMCAFAAWDRSIAERGCYSASKAIKPILRRIDDETNDTLTVTQSEDPSQMELFDDVPLLSRFNLQGFYSTVWDHPDLSKLLVTLVEACDKRDLKGVVESAVRCNKRRMDECANFQDTTMDSHYGTVNSLISFGDTSIHAVEFDIYRAVLYLAKYQCTSAFHSFFPTTLKPCKGYHFWCANGTPLPTFDRLLRDAVRRVNLSTRENAGATTHDVSDIALAFRCVFGHLI